ncbi:MAG: hypothetical protein HDR88_16975, partial [Bacteroides sp.]|nr:hypothetical protein [Bacteroides sp.]
VPYSQSLDKLRDIQAGILYAADEAREKGYSEGLEKGLQEGLEKGLQEGLEKGLEKGRAETIAEKIKRAKELGLPDSIINQLFEISL